MSRGLKLYYDFMSQPSRALYIFLSTNKVPFERCPVALRKFEQKTPEYRKNVNRYGKVPCIVEQDFRLAESVAIYRYVCREYPVAPHWYPADTVRQARIDEYLSWQHLNIRADVSLYFFHVWLNPLMGKEVDAAKTDRLRDRLKKGLDFFEHDLLANGKRPFLAGDTISIADLSAACEIEQVKIAGYDPCGGRPHLSAWLGAVRERTNPYYDEAHKYVYRLAPDHISTPAVPEDD
ncbi:glutathione S-transferase theta-2-like [Anopheles stephensi]|uniref:glutathione transferase n=1 Tax=Anopheles stephensi TaxID=30069 RepID=A0A182Y4U4_ANOST|nr:glutathione S-transferase theta-2-like [Anopheles stephensi]XP_035893581.1 glutathione S-transferase theta-2-like [Anopheles stephensi]XP_035893589.1 glutathione S-transferase theta-2-like [Anopheles stephensi]